MTLDDKLVDAIMTAVKRLSVHQRRDLIYKLLEANADAEEMSGKPLTAPPNLWVM